ncbi:MAG: hypothetical protein Kow00122_02410 [Thermoleophilia bacterium]
MAAEDALRAAHIPLQVIPKPPTFGPGCGLAVKVAEKDRRRAATILRQETIPFFPPQRVD